MSIVGVIVAALVGILLGLTGGGGALFATLALIYVLHVSPTLATTYSFFIVGVSSVLGILQRRKTNPIDFKAALVFATPSIVTVYLMRRYVMPAVPSLITVGGVTLSKDRLIMLGLALLLITIAWFMVPRRSSPVGASQRPPAIASIRDGALVGVLAGIFGVGGGFIMVPALTLRSQLPIQRAISTALLVISVNSFVGLMGDLIAHQPIDWVLLLPFTVCMAAGTWIGGYIAGFLPNSGLKIVISSLLFVVGLYIAYREVAFMVGVFSP